MVVAQTQVVEVELEKLVTLTDKLTAEMELHLR